MPSAVFSTFYLSQRPYLVSGTLRDQVAVQPQPLDPYPLLVLELSEEEILACAELTDHDAPCKGLQCAHREKSVLV